MKVLHVISSLGQGGAEGVLYRLISASKHDVEHVVVSMVDEDYYGPRLRALGIPVHVLGNPRGRLTLSGLLKLRKIFMITQPDVVQTWMYHADLVGGLMARWCGNRLVFWGVRNSNLDAGSISFSARAVAKVCAFLSPWIPAAIVCCSVQAAHIHQSIGYCRKKFVIISNGYDLSRFVPDAEVRTSMRAQWNVKPSQILLGMVARWDPQKDHDNLLHALVKLKEVISDLRCVLVGTGIDKNNSSLTASIRQLGLEDWIILAGPRSDIPAVMNALDLHILSSLGEAFPNTVAEAMACGTPCVVTDVGDAAVIVAETGWVVPPQDSVALAGGIERAISELANAGRDALGLKCRRQIEENFSLEKMVQAYTTLWRSVLPGDKETLQVSNE